MTGIFSLHPEDPIGVGAPRAIDPNSVNTAGWWGGIGTTLATAPIRALMAVGDGRIVGRLDLCHGRLLEMGRRRSHGRMVSCRSTERKQPCCLTRTSTGSVMR